MKVALLICGQARFFNVGYDSIKEKIIDVYNPDIYIHTWKYKDNITYSAPWNRLGQIIITEDDINQYIQLYRPKAYEIEEALTNIPLKREIYERISSHETRYNYYSYLYSLNKCYNLSKQNSIYDVYIIIRSDVIIFNFPSLDVNYIQIYDRFPTRRHEVLETMVCTVPVLYMDTFANLVNKLDDYYDLDYGFNYEEMSHAHFNEQRLYDNTMFIDSSKLKWGYYRKSRIEVM